MRYSVCCGVLHGGVAAATAEALMRSRYSAYVQGNADYLLHTWAVATRPLTLDISTPPQPRWLGLKVLSQREDGESAEVEFVARFRMAGRAQVLHEVSRFQREEWRWVYVDRRFV